MTGGSGPGTELARLYRDAIRQHSSRPEGYRRDIAATHRHEEYNPQCGDRIELMLRLAGDEIEAAAFDGEACAICMASASLLCTLAPGRSVGGLGTLGEGLQNALKEPAQTASAALDSAGSQQATLLHPDLHPLLGVRPYPSRVRCATLPWTAAMRAAHGPEAG